MLLRLLTLVLGFATAQYAHAAVIERTANVTFSATQLFNQGEFGGGVFWRPEFQLDPFTVMGAGDQLTLTVHLVGGRLSMFAGADEQEAVGASLFSSSASGVKAAYRATFEFLGVQGDLLTPTGSQDAASEGNGIGANFNPVDLSDTSFSFDGLRIVFSISNGVAGFPVDLDTGMVAVQTQGSFVFLAVPEPSSLLLSAPLLAMLRLRRSR